MTAQQIEAVLKHSFQIGEGPFWCPRRNLLFFVDIPEKTVVCYDPAKKDAQHLKLEGDHSFVSLIIPVEGKDDEFVIARSRTISLLKWSPGSTDYSITDLHTVEEGKPNNRFNDGKCDPRGRLWAGTMGTETKNKPGYVDEPEGALYMVDETGCYLKLVDVELSNGLGWSLDGNTMYFVDTPKKTVEAFDYNLETGGIKNRRVVFDLVANNVEGLPDGLTIDAKGNIWLALFTGHKVIEIDSSNGKLLSEIEFPAKHMTSATFGGPNLADLYITSAGIVRDKSGHNPLDGSLFRISSLKSGLGNGIQGTPNIPFKM